MKSKTIQKIFLGLFLLLIIFKSFSFINQEEIPISSDLVEYIVINYTYYSLLFYVLVTIFFSIIASNQLKNYLKSIGTKYWVFLLIIFLFGLIIRLTTSPMYDPARSGGSEYLLSAKSFVLKQEYINCDLGSFNNCLISGSSNHPAGYAFFLNLIFSVFGLTAKSALYFNVLVGSLTAVLIFLIFNLLFKEKMIALLSTFFFLLLKNHVSYSGTAEDMIFNVFFLSLTIFLFLFTIHTKNWKILSLTILSFFFLVQIRNEQLFLLIIFILFYFIFVKKGHKQIVRNKKQFIYLSFILFFCFLSFFPIAFLRLSNPDFRESSFAMTITAPSSNNQNAIFSTKYLKKYFPKIIKEIYNLPKIAIPILFVTFFYFFKNKKITLFFLSTIFLHLTIYGSYWPGDLQRYIINIYPSISILIGLGILNIISLAKQKKLFISKNHLVILFVLLILSSSFFSEKVFVGEPSEVELGEKEIPKNSIIIVPNWNEVWRLQFKNTKFVMPIYQLLNNQKMFELIRDNKERTYYFETNPCRAIPSFGCEYMEETFNLKLLKTKKEFKYLNIYSLKDIKIYYLK
jgi:hypothetical protein